MMALGILALIIMISYCSYSTYYYLTWKPKIDYDKIARDAEYNLLAGEKDRFKGAITQIDLYVDTLQKYEK